jgi:thiamine pyrophosphokinase
MRCVIFANGDYGDMDYYYNFFNENDICICADGGANYAYRLGIIPEFIIGDMDSINDESRKHFEMHRVKFLKYSSRKDLTDLQLALSLAEELGAREIALLGTQGKRIDHSLSNLYSGIIYAQKGIKVIHYRPESLIYIISGDLTLEGKPGDLVSLLPLGEAVCGVSLQGFEYPLENTVLDCTNPYAISNVLTQNTGCIKVGQGILAVFHYTR